MAQLSLYMVQVQLRAVSSRAVAALASPTSPALSDFSLLSHDTRSGATSVGSAHAFSDFEASSFYLGISDDHPLLLYRTGSESTHSLSPRASKPIARSSRFGVFVVPRSTPSGVLWVPLFAT